MTDQCVMVVVKEHSGFTLAFTLESAEVILVGRQSTKIFIKAIQSQKKFCYFNIFNKH